VLHLLLLLQQRKGEGEGWVVLALVRLLRLLRLVLLLVLLRLLEVLLLLQQLLLLLLVLLLLLEVALLQHVRVGSRHAPRLRPSSQRLLFLPLHLAPIAPAAATATGRARQLLLLLLRPARDASATRPVAGSERGREQSGRVRKSGGSAWHPDKSGRGEHPPGGVLRRVALGAWEGVGLWAWECIGG
jgi:hypothetical protein